jgi:hypothetical protein
MIQLKFIINILTYAGKHACKRASLNKFRNQVSTFVLLRIIGVESGKNSTVVREKTTWGAIRLWMENVGEGRGWHVY